MPEEKPTLAWIGCSCPWCGWSGKVEVKETDAKGKHIVRCLSCGERIKVE